jgi:hypothetical protein
MNAYLRELADICGVKKHLTTHLSRHTFATSVALANGVSIENIAKMLGHSSTNMTRHYARVLDKSIMAIMNGKFAAAGAGWSTNSANEQFVPNKLSEYVECQSTTSTEVSGRPKTVRAEYANG